MCVFWLWRVPPCWHLEWGRGGGVTPWMQPPLHGGSPAADEMLAELVFEFNRVIDICTRQDRRVLRALLWLLIWLQDNNLLMAVKLLSQELWRSIWETVRGGGSE